ncbi:lysophospholipid acyltransferase 6-like [Glandiceps talaboti]
MAFGFLITLADMAKLPLQEMLFPFLQGCSLILAIIYRHVLHPTKVSPTTRHVVATAIGLTIGFSCYSWSMLHLLLHSTVGYCLMKFLNRKYMAMVVFFVSMAYLSIEHLRKTMMDDSSQLLHHETPMMAMTMKITSVAFGLHDGSAKDGSNLHPKQRKEAIRRFPPVLEYYSYIFHFQTFLVGPFCFYTDYIDFIQGKHLVPYKIKTKDGKEVIISREPSVMIALFRKSMFFITSTVIVYFFSRYYPLKGIMTDLVCNASGFGFNGYDENGKPKWDLVIQIHVLKFLTSIDINDTLASWNVTAVRWLKYACYYRVPYHKDKLTLLLSAVWHGFCPGYYWALVLNFTIGRNTSRTMHLYMKEFITTTGRKLVYSSICWVFNTLLLQYFIAPFVLESHQATVELYR